jgi:hypothetical protein
MVAAPVGGVILYDEYVLVLNHRLTTGAERAIRTSNHRAPVASAQVAPLR